jgi:hypothetical protein
VTPRLRPGHVDVHPRNTMFGSLPPEAFTPALQISKSGTRRPPLVGSAQSVSTGTPLKATKLTTK